MKQHCNQKHSIWVNATALYDKTNQYWLGTWRCNACNKFFGSNYSDMQNNCNRCSHCKTLLLTK